MFHRGIVDWKLPLIKKECFVLKYYVYKEFIIHLRNMHVTFNTIQTVAGFMQNILKSTTTVC